MQNTVFHITYRPALEFLYALIMVAQEDQMNSIKKSKVIKDKSILEYLENLNDRLSNYTKNEIKYFVLGGENSCDGIAQDIIMHFLMKNRNINAELDLIDEIRNTSAFDLAKTIFCNALSYLNVDNHNFYEIQEEEQMVNILKELTFPNKERKEVILDSIAHSEELKERLLLTLQTFYDKAYSIVYKDMEEKTKPYIKRYQEELDQDKVKFCRKYHNCNLDAYDKELFIHISFSRFVGADMYVSSASQDEWFIMGMYTSEELEQAEEGEKIGGFLKTVSDKKRMQIINLLKKQPAFVNEIADYMNMTAPTVSYHLTALQEYEIVDFERSDHRLYYHLNKEKLEEWFEIAKDYYVS